MSRTSLAMKSAISRSVMIPTGFLVSATTTTDPTSILAIWPATSDNRDPSRMVTGARVMRSSINMLHLLRILKSGSPRSSAFLVDRCPGLVEGRHRIYGRTALLDPDPVRNPFHSPDLAHQPCGGLRLQEQSDRA